MNIVERAGRELGLSLGKSLVEKAAERLTGGEFAAAPTRDARPEVVAPQHTPVTPTGRRETRRRITLDFDALRSRGLALPRDQSGLAEEMRLIKRPLLGAAFASEAAVNHANVIMVTSANPNEGKTFTAANLAFSIASEHETHVLLVDADVANPTIPGMLGFDAEMGLMDVVAESGIEMADILVATNIPNLTILPAGRPRSGASELLASARMARFVDDVAGRYADRIVIFDSPPVRARSEPLILTQYVGQIVFVVEAERTSRVAVAEALASIGTKKVGGIVLNKAPPTPSHGYGYYNGAGSR
jgi:protein-tyrosine kinase